MKRETVSKMLTKRLAISKRSIKDINQFNDMVDVLGGTKYPDQFFTNQIKDIKQLEYLIKCLKEFKS